MNKFDFQSEQFLLWCLCSKIRNQKNYKAIIIKRNPKTISNNFMDFRTETWMLDLRYPE
jgi:hypothetical protein